MSDPRDPTEEHERAKQIDEHEGLDPKTVIEDAKKLFEPDNRTVPPPQPDAPTR
jgi:hypothetical protein